MVVYIPVAEPLEVERKMVMGLGPGIATRGVMSTTANPAASPTEALLSVMAKGMAACEGDGRK